MHFAALVLELRGKKVLDVEMKDDWKRNRLNVNRRNAYRRLNSGFPNVKTGR